MKTTRKIALFLLLACMLFLPVFTGCNSDQSGNTIDEPELTTEYLSDEYAQQLMTDGAKTMLGAISIEKSDNTYTVHITEKEVVPNSGYEDGYYIADTNVVKDIPLGSEARIVCEDEDNDEFLMSSADDFIENHPDGSEDLYTIYLMGDSAELILLTEPEDVMADEDQQ